MQDSTLGAVQTRQGLSSVAVRITIPSLSLSFSISVCVYLCSFVALVKVNEQLVSGAGGAAASIKSVFLLCVKESFLGLGLFAVWNVELFKPEMCFWEVSAMRLSQFLGLCPSLGSGEDRMQLQSIQQQGQGCGEPGVYCTVNLYVVLPYKNKPQSVSRPREKRCMRQM